MHHLRHDGQRCHGERGLSKRRMRGVLQSILLGRRGQYHRVFRLRANYRHCSGFLHQWLDCAFKSSSVSSVIWIGRSVFRRHVWLNDDRFCFDLDCCGGDGLADCSRLVAGLEPDRRLLSAFCMEISLRSRLKLYLCIVNHRQCINIFSAQLVRDIYCI